MTMLLGYILIAFFYLPFYLPVGAFTAVAAKGEITWRHILLSLLVFLAFFGQFGVLIALTGTQSFVFIIATHFATVIALLYVFAIAKRITFYITERDAPMVHFLLMQGILAVIILDIISASIYTLARFPDAQLLAATVGAIALSAALFTKIRKDIEFRSLKQIASSSALTLALILLCFSAIQWYDFILFFVYYYTWMALVVAFLMKFTRDGGHRYWLAMLALVIWILISFTWATLADARLPFD